MNRFTRSLSNLILVCAATIASFEISTFLPVAGVLGLAGIVTLPGYLLMLILRPRRLSPTEWLLYSLGLSLLFIMLLGLIANIALPLLGQVHPLAPGSMIPVFGSLLAVELVGVWLRNRGGTSSRIALPYQITARKAALGSSFALLPALSVLGANVLNNGGSGVFSAIAITLVAASAVTLVALHRHVPSWLWAWATFCLALALLWATSLRGWYITGHDIQVEYYVFKLTDAGKRWTMSNFQDAYNACLSITILPTVLKSLTGIDAVALYKVFYQVLFAAFTTGVLVLSRRFASPVIAFVAAFVFITFPTYITDMPMLNRQEMAFGFFTLMLITIFNGNLSGRIRRLLIVLLGMGTVISHYSTTFVAVGLLLCGYVILIPLRRILAKYGDIAPRRRAITVGSVSVLIAGTILWTGIYTKTGNNITGTVAAAAKSLPTVLSPKSGSSSSGAGSGAQTPQQLIDLYSTSQIKLTAAPVAQAGGLYPDFASYKLTSSPPPTPPLTPFGQLMASVGATPHLIISIMKTGYALGLEFMLLVGAVMAMVYRRRWKLSTDFIVLAPVGVILLGIQVVLPVIDYGLLRMMQQDMVFMSLPIVLAALQIMSWTRIRSKTMQLTILTNIFAIAFLFLSGVVNQVTGGGEPQLAVSNSGFYYDAYYTNGSDMAMYAWLKNNYPAGYPINSDRFSRVKIVANTGITTVDGIAPSSLSKDSYVVLSNANVLNDSVAMYYSGQLVFYKYPTDFLNNNKDLLYSNSANKIYH